MFEFQVPEDLTECSAEDLQECITEAKTEFGLLNESDDLSDATLDRMGELSDGIAALYQEVQGRQVETATQKRSTLVKQIKEARFSSVRASYKADTVAKRDQLAATMESLVDEFYNKCNSPTDGRFCEGSDGPGAGMATSDAKSTAARNHPGYEKAHKYMADDLVKAEKLVEGAKGLKAKNQAREVVGKIRQESIRWAVEVDRNGEQVDTLEKQLEQAKGLTEKNKVRRSLSAARSELGAVINNKLGRYEGYADDPYEGMNQKQAAVAREQMDRVEEKARAAPDPYKNYYNPISNPGKKRAYPGGG